MNSAVCSVPKRSLHSTRAASSQRSGQGNAGAAYLSGRPSCSGRLAGRRRAPAQPRQAVLTTRAVASPQDLPGLPASQSQWNRAKAMIFQGAAAVEDRAGPWHLLELSHRQLDALYQLTRAWNILPSIALVLLGAWLGCGKAMAPAVLLAHAGTVLFTAVASAAIACASCAVNDYFDARLDVLNDTSKPIPSGAVSLDGALLLASLTYICFLALACLVNVPGVRIVIAASAIATMAYTPLLKRMVIVKNLTVAATVAAAPIAGALAAGAAATLAGLQPVLLPSAFILFIIWWRETIMDITDVAGDRAAGVATLPVVLGPHSTLAFCRMLLAAAAAVSVHVALHGTGLAWLWAATPHLERGFRLAGAAAALAVVGRLALAAERARLADFSPESVSRVVKLAMLPTTGYGIVLLTLLA